MKPDHSKLCQILKQITKAAFVHPSLRPSIRAESNYTLAKKRCKMANEKRLHSNEMSIALSVQRCKYSIFGTDFNCQSSLLRGEGGYQISQTKIALNIFKIRNPRLLITCLTGA